MRNCAILLFLVPFLFCSSVHGQGTAGKANIPVNKGTELREVSIVAPSAAPTYKVDNVAKREKIDHPKAPFDVANEYDSLFARSANAGLNRKTETGVVKFMNDNSNIPMVLYNNACTGTILLLTNPENGKTVYALVVGKIAPTESNIYLLKISDMVARKLSIKEYDSIELTGYMDITR